jgi:hypothetical protein
MKIVAVLIVVWSLLGLTSVTLAGNQITEPAVDNPSPPEPIPSYGRPVVRAAPTPNNSK